MTALTGQDILNRFHLYTADLTELSTEDELNLLNKVYDGVMGDRPWSFLKTSATGSISQTGNEYYITLPTDFRYFIENNQYTDNSSSTYNNATPKVIFVGDDYTPVQLINWSDRRQFRNNNQYAYKDVASNRVVFCGTPSGSTYELDYIRNWDDITLATSPLFSADFHDMLPQLMAIDADIINLSEKARSYAPENQKAADDAMKGLRYLDSMNTFN